jgi:O-antigen/teichoic acid export membrane protein
MNHESPPHLRTGSGALTETREFERPAFLSSALFTLGTQVAVAGLSLVNVLIVARSLGPEGRGQVALLMTIAYLSSQVALFGVEQANVNFAGTRPTTRPALATNSLVLAAVFGVAAILLVAGLIAVVPAVGGGIARGLRWASLASIPVLIFQTYLLLLVRGSYQFTFANAGYMAVPIVNVAANGILAAAGVITVATAFGAWLGGQAVATLIFAWCVGRRVGGFGRPDPRLAREMVAFGARAQGGRIMMLGNYRFDQWLVGGIAGTRELGLYSVAVAWAEALFHLPTALAAVQRPDLVRASPRETTRQTGLVFRAAALVTIPLALAIVAAAPFLCVTIFGDDFRGSVNDLRVLAAGAFGILALKLLGNALTAQGKPMLETAAIASAFTATIILDVLLIPPYAGLGAAIASSVAYTAGGVAVVLLFTRAFGGRFGDLVPRRRDIADLRERARALRHGSASAKPTLLAPTTPDAGDGRYPPN